MDVTISHDALDRAPIQSKTAAVVARDGHPLPGSLEVRDFSIIRDVLFSQNLIQAGRGADEIPKDHPEQLPVFFLDGELHKKRRSQIARFFTPKTIRERYRGIMDRSIEKLIGQLRQSGRERLDLLSFDLACEVTSEIVGLTESDPQKLAKRIREAFVATGFRKAIATLKFYWLDVVPSMKVRRKQSRDDVMSLIIEQGYSKKSILIECLTYGSAGMMTTREFIVVAAWHLFDRPDLRQAFLDGSDEEQFEILDEILRIEPVVTYLQRRATADETRPNGEVIKAGQLYAFDVRAANLEERTVGKCPYAIEPGRAKREKVQGNWVSFGAGPHRCPGGQVALHETRLFLDALFRLPGIRMVNEPTVSWTGTTYELRGAFVECDRA